MAVICIGRDHEIMSALSLKPELDVLSLFHIHSFTFIHSFIHSGVTPLLSPYTLPYDQVRIGIGMLSLPCGFQDPGLPRSGMRERDGEV